MRLKIATATNYLHLRPGTSLQLDMQSPLQLGDRDTDLFPGVKTYTIAVPNTSHNRGILGRPDALDNPDDFLDEDGWYIYYDGFLVLEGRLEVEDGVKDSDINITFIGGLAGNLDSMKDTYLYNLDLGGDIDAGSTDAAVLAFAKSVTDNPDLYEFRFPTIQISKDGEPDEDGPTRYQYLNLYQAGAFQRSGTVEGQPVYSTLCPMPRLRYVLEQAVEAAAYTLKGVFDTHPLAAELDELILVSNRSLDVFLEPAVPDTYAFDDMSLNDTINLAQQVPAMKSAELVRAVCNLLCLAPVLDTAARTIILTWCGELLALPYRDDWTSKVDPIYKRDRQLEDIPSQFRYDHTNTDGYAGDWQKKLNGIVIDHVFGTIAEARAAITLADGAWYVYIDSINECFREQAYIRGAATLVRFESLGKDLGIINPDTVPGYSPNSDTLHMITVSEKLGRVRPDFVGQQYLPAYYADIITPMQQGGKLIEDLIFLIYRGLQSGYAGPQYPLASSGRHDYNEDEIGDLSLLWGGPQGLYATWWADWIAALQAMRPVTYATRLTAADLATLDWRRKVRIDKHQYFLKRIQITLTTDEILPAQVEYMQIN